MIDLELSASVVLEVVEAEPSIRGDTATNVTKKVVCQTGLEVKAPQHIHVGDKITVRPSTAPERRIEGAVFAMGSRIQATSRTLKVRARIPNPDETIRPGTSFEVALAFTGRRYPLVREVAVLWSRDGSYVWTVREDMPERVFVDIVRREKGRALIKGALDRDDLIVVEGVQSVRPGRKVETQLAPDEADRQQADSGGST